VIELVIVRGFYRGMFVIVCGGFYVKLFYVMTWWFLIGVIEVEN
jgi:hypothetical protein